MPKTFLLSSRICYVFYVVFFLIVMHCLYILNKLISLSCNFYVYDSCYQTPHMQRVRGPNTLGCFRQLQMYRRISMMCPSSEANPGYGIVLIKQICIPGINFHNFKLCDALKRPALYNRHFCQFPSVVAKYRFDYTLLVNKYSLQSQKFKVKFYNVW